MPSARPVKPSRSVVVALTLTRSASSERISAMRSIMAARWGPIFGRSQIMVTSRWVMRPPLPGQVRPHAAGNGPKRRLANGDRSAGNACRYRRRRWHPAARRSARADPTSASEWPSRLHHAGRDAADRTWSPGAKRVDVEALADAKIAEPCSDQPFGGSRSSAVVTLKLSSLPGTTTGAMPRLRQPRQSSVSSRPAAARCAARIASK